MAIVDRVAEPVEPEAEKLTSKPSKKPITLSRAVDGACSLLSSDVGKRGLELDEAGAWAPCDC